MLPCCFAYPHLYIIQYGISSCERLTRGGPPALELFMFVPTLHHKCYVKSGTECYVHPLTLKDCLARVRVLPFHRVNLISLWFHKGREILLIN